MPDVLEFAAVLSALLYGLWQLRNYGQWRSLAAVPPVTGATALPKIAVIVPFRDEAGNLPGLVASLRRQDYPPAAYEIILVDDHSSDGGGKTVGAAAGAREGFPEPALPQVRVLSLAEQLAGRQVVAHKKAALAYGIAQTTAEIVLTTDADCTLPPDLLPRLARAFTPLTDVVLGPVFISEGSGLLHAFQALDLAGYQLYTAAMVAGGAPGLANGACLAFRRERFLEAGGYAGVDHLPSGDDVLLLHKFNAAGFRADWLPGHSPVYTKPVGTWRALWLQRLRWAGKAGSYVHPGLQFGQALAYLTSLLLMLALLTLPWHLRPRPLVLLWGTKFLVDYFLLRSVLQKYRQAELLAWYPVVAFLYPFYLVAVGTAALLGIKAGWKGR